MKLVFYALESGDPVGDLEMSGELYHWVAIASQAAGQSVGDFIEQAVREKIPQGKVGEMETSADSQVGGTAAGESADAANQAHALMSLIVETMDAQNLHTGHWSEARANTMWAGINQLCEQTAARLHRAADGGFRLTDQNAGYLFETEALRNIAEVHGRLTVDELENQAADLELQARWARVAALAVTDDPAAWDRAGAANPISDDDGRRGELNGKAGAR